MIGDYFPCAMRMNDTRREHFVPARHWEKDVVFWQSVRARTESPEARDLNQKRIEMAEDWCRFHQSSGYNTETEDHRQARDIKVDIVGCRVSQDLDQ